MRLRWARQQVGMWIAFDEKGRSVGYVFNRGGRNWSAQCDATMMYAVFDTVGAAKDAVRAAIRDVEVQR